MHLVPLIATAAQAYHGGYNVACRAGIFPDGKAVDRPRHQSRPIRRRWRSSVFPTGTARDNASN